MRLCEKIKWFEDDEIGWVSDKVVELHVTLLLYILKVVYYLHMNDTCQTLILFGSKRKKGK